MGGKILLPALVLKVKRGIEFPKEILLGIEFQSQDHMGKQFRKFGLFFFIVFPDDTEVTCFSFVVMLLINRIGQSAGRHDNEVTPNIPGPVSASKLFECFQEFLFRVKFGFRPMFQKIFSSADGRLRRSKQRDLELGPLHLCRRKSFRRRQSSGLGLRFGRLLFLGFLLPDKCHLDFLLSKWKLGAIMVTSRKKGGPSTWPRNLISPIPMKMGSWFLEPLRFSTTSIPKWVVSRNIMMRLVMRTLLNS